MSSDKHAKWKQKSTIIKCGKTIGKCGNNNQVKRNENIPRGILSLHRKACT